MTICDPIIGCGRDKRAGGMRDGVWVCGSCDPEASVAQQPRGAYRNQGTRGRP